MESPPSDVPATLKTQSSILQSSFDNLSTLTLQTFVKTRSKRDILWAERKKKLGYSWATLQFVVLLHVMIVTPFETAFLPICPSVRATEDPIFIMNRIVDVFFLFDVGVNAYASWKHFRKSTARKRALALIHQTRNIGGVPGRLRLKTLISYLTSWGLLDILTLISVYLDIESVSQCEAQRAQRSPTWQADALKGLVNGTISDEGSDVAFSVLRLVRILRLFKVARIVKGSNLIKAYSQSMEWSYSTSTLIWLLVKYLVLAHLIACILCFKTQFAPDRMHSWLREWGYCIYASDYVEARQNAQDSFDDAAIAEYPWVPEYAHPQILCAAPTQMYIGCLFRAFLLLVAGEGGDDTRGVMTSGEQLTFAFILVCSAILYAEIIGTFSNIISNLDTQRNRFRQHMDELNSFMRANDHWIGESTKTRLRQYLVHAESVPGHLATAEANTQLLSLMSPKLRAETILAVSSHWLERIEWLRSAEQDCWVDIALALEAILLVPLEMTREVALYQIKRGVVLYYNRVVCSGMCFGKDAILSNPSLRRWAGRALTYVEGFKLPRDALIDIVQSYPQASAAVRWSALRTALIRTLIETAVSMDAELRPALSSKPDRAAKGKRGKKKRSRLSSLSRFASSRGLFELALMRATEIEHMRPAENETAEIMDSVEEDGVAGTNRSDDVKKVMNGVKEYQPPSSPEIEAAVARACESTIRAMDKDPSGLNISSPGATAIMKQLVEMRSEMAALRREVAVLARRPVVKVDI